MNLLPPALSPVGTVEAVCGVTPPASAGASLGRVLRSRVSTAKGFFFQPRQYVQRPCVQGLGGALIAVIHRGSSCRLVVESKENTNEFQQVGNHFREDGKNFQGEQNERFS